MVALIGSAAPELATGDVADRLAFPTIDGSGLGVLYYRNLAARPSCYKQLLYEKRSSDPSIRTAQKQ